MQTCVETCLCTLWSWRHVESSRSHVGRTDGLNLLHSAEFWLGQQLRAQEEKNPLYYIYKKQEIAVAFSQTLAFSSAFPATLEHNNQVWLLLKKKQQGKVIFFFFVFPFSIVTETARIINMRGVYLIKVCYDLVEKTETLQSLLIDIRLSIKLFEVWDGGEHHTHRLVRLMIKVLVTSEKKITALWVVLIWHRWRKSMSWIARAEQWHRLF